MKRIYSICLFAGLTLSALAQETKVSIRTLALKAGKFPDIWAMADEKAIALPFSAVQPSVCFRLDRLSPMSLYAGNLPEQKSPSSAKPTQIPMPDAASVLILGWMLNDQPHFLAIKDSLDLAQANDWMVINSTSATVGVQIGATQKPILIKPACHKDLRVSAPTEGGTAITIAENKSGKWRKFYSTYWATHAEKRCLILLVNDGEKIQVKQIFDDLPKPQEKAEGAGK